MPDEQLPTQHADAVPPGWQVLPDNATAAPNLLPGWASHGSRLSLLGIDHHLGRFSRRCCSLYRSACRLDHGNSP